MQKPFTKFLPFVLSLGALVSCGGGAKAKTATVTVVNGTGGGTFNIGTSVTVTATVPEHKSFKEWQSEEKFVSDANPYTFTLEKDITLTATFNEVATYTINVINGTGSGVYSVNSEVNITPTNPNKFRYWFLDTDNVVLSRTANYTFKATKDVTIRAIEDNGMANYVSTIEHDFSNNQPFKVLSLTDIQLDDGKDLAVTKKVIDDLVTNYQPDLITYLGDMLHDNKDYDSKTNPKAVIDYIDAKNIPWAPVLGNHDYDTYHPVGSRKTTTTEELIGWYEAANNCLVKRSASKYAGKLNYIVNVVDKNTHELKKSLYMIDSNQSGVEDSNAQFYLDAVNYNGNDIPSAVYTHIALPQYGEAYEASKNVEYRDVVGSINRDPCDLASGSRKVFENIKKTGASDIVICGHDHENAYYSVYDGIKLAYSMKSSDGDGYTNIAETGGGLLKMNTDGTNDFEYVKASDISHTIDNDKTASFNPDTLGYWRYSGNKFECDVEFGGDSGTIDLNFQGTNLLRYQLTLKERLGQWNRLTKNATFNASNKTVNYGTLTHLDGNKYHYSLDLATIPLNNGSGEVAHGDETLRLCYFNACSILGGFKVSNIKYIPEEITEDDQKDLNTVSIAAIDDQFYVKDQYQKPDLTVTDGVAPLSPINDYLAIYTNNIEVGTATVKIVPSGKGAHRYKGEKVVNFNIIRNPDDDEYPGHESAKRFDDSCTLEDDDFITCNNWKNVNKSLSFEVKKLNYGSKKEGLINKFALHGTNQNVSQPGKWNRLTIYYYFYFSEDDTAFSIKDGEGNVVATGIKMEHDNWFKVILPLNALDPNKTSGEEACGGTDETIQLWYFAEMTRSFKLDHIALVDTPSNVF